MQDGEEWQIGFLEGLQHSKLSQFSKYGTDCYPDRKHHSPRSTTKKTVRETMTELFGLQGIPISWDDECVDKLPTIMEKLKEALDDPIINPKPISAKETEKN